MAIWIVGNSVVASMPVFTSGETRTWMSCAWHAMATHNAASNVAAGRQFWVDNGLSPLSITRSALLLLHCAERGCTHAPYGSLISSVVPDFWLAPVSFGIDVQACFVSNRRADPGQPVHSSFTRIIHAPTSVCSSLPTGGQCRPGAVSRGHAVR